MKYCGNALAFTMVILLYVMQPTNAQAQSHVTANKSLCAGTPNAPYSQNSCAAPAVVYLGSSAYYLLEFENLWFAGAATASVIETPPPGFELNNPNAPVSCYYADGPLAGTPAVVSYSSPIPPPIFNRSN